MKNILIGLPLVLLGLVLFILLKALLGDVFVIALSIVLIIIQIFILAWMLGEELKGKF